MLAARLDRTLLTPTTLGLLAALAAGCAGGAKVTKPTTDVADGAVAGAGAVEAPPARVEPPPVAPPPPACTLARVHFGFDSVALEEPARAALQEAAACIAQKRPAELVIEGHCDERGTAAYNVALGNKRANVVKGYLTDLGVTAALMPISFGEELPLVQGEGEAVWSQNRRAELRLPGERRTDGSVVAGR